MSEFQPPKSDTAAAAIWLRKPYAEGVAAAIRDAGSEDKNEILKRKREIRAQLKSYESEVKHLDRELSFLKRKQEAVRDIIAWAENAQTHGGFILERPTSSVLHKLQSAVQAGQLITYDEEIAKSPANKNHWPTPPFLEFNSFVVTHDWAKAFDGAIDFDGGEYRLPYDLCCFEIKLSGKRICALVGETDGERVMHPVLYTSAGWLYPPITYLFDGKSWNPVGQTDAPYQSIVNYIGTHVRAICIALDATVATSEVVRAPEKLNAERLKRGVLPLVDYHIVSLTRRQRTEPIGEHSSVKHRLHFVRGHWRHYQNHKTWIKWHLRGDPDLGFIDKHYTL